jgi:Ca-activated chloride channel homolog
MTLRNPELLLLLLLIPVIWTLWAMGGRRIAPAAVGLRTLIVALLAFALADPLLGRNEAAPGPLVVLVDQSDSLTEAGKTALWEQARALARGAAGPVSVIAFGAEARAVPPDLLAERSMPANAGRCPIGAAACPEPDGSDIAGALRGARELLGAGGGRIALLSDGLATSGDALAEAELARSAGIAVDVLPFTPDAVQEVALSALSAPPSLRVGEEYTVRAILQSNVATEGIVRIYADGALVDEQRLSIAPETSVVSTTLRTAAPGLLRLRAEVEAAIDTFPRNNSAAATAFIARPPRLLIIEGEPGNAASLKAALRAEGVESETISPPMLPSQLSILQPFDGMLLSDVPAQALTLDQMLTVREFVRSEGRGLVVIGGRNSYGLGGYKGTPLEEALPVTMDPPPKKTRPDVALLLIIDHSASMNDPGGVIVDPSSPGPTKFEMAKEAAIQATETLEGEDRVGVLIFDTLQEWTVPFQQLGEGLALSQIQDRIARIGLGGGTDILGALQVGLPDLERQDSQVRHAILLTDGRSFDTERDPYRELVGRVRAGEISLSTIAIGLDSDQALLKDLADWGGGRYHYAARAEDIPRLTLLESEIARSDPVVEQTFRAELASRHPVLRDFAPSQLPQLDGYVATSVKPEAEVALRSPDEDPVLAVWQYGLGRAVAWTPNSEAPWAAAWPQWPAYGRFWSQVVRYSLPQPDSGPLQVRVIEDDGLATLQVDSTWPSGEPLDLAATEATITLPDGSTRSLPLRQVAPGRYQQELALQDDGPYGIAVTQTRDGQQRQATTGYVRRTPAEYLPGGSGDALLGQIAEISGGRLLDGALGGEAQPPPELASARPLWPWLLLLALLLWPLEVAITRGWFEPLRAR